MGGSKNKEYESRSDSTCDISCLRGLLIAFNFFFILAGCGALAVGIWTVIGKMEFSPLLASATYTLIVYMLIIVGAVILITGIIGCVGATQKSSLSLTIYFILMVILLIIEIVAGITSFVYRDSIHDELSNDLMNNINSKYNQTDSKSLTQAVDVMQQRFECCGVSTHSDWIQSRFYVESAKVGTNLKVPDSCCKTVTPDCGKRDHPSNIYAIMGDTPTGCMTKLESYFQEHLIVLAIAGFAVAGVQIAVMIFACCLRRKIIEDDSRY